MHLRAAAPVEAVTVVVEAVMAAAAAREALGRT